MGQAPSCSSKGALLLVASANGDTQVAQEVRKGLQCVHADRREHTATATRIHSHHIALRVCTDTSHSSGYVLCENTHVHDTSHSTHTHTQILRNHPRAALYYNFKDLSSPLIQASGVCVIGVLWLAGRLSETQTARVPVNECLSCCHHTPTPHHKSPPRTARGHFELVQMLLEAAVMSEGVERANRHCIDHVNVKRQTALMVACKHG